MQRMPVVFIGHGSPMNAIEENKYTQGWRELVKQIPKPEAILSVSAHWYTKGTRVNDLPKPKQVYDMYGFPDELYNLIYDCQGAPEFAHLTQSLVSKETVIDNTWGIDHGTWSVLVKMYPEADIPVYQLSVDGTASPEEHYNIGKQLRSLREKGVLILGSGNVVHNLGRIDWSKEDGFDWAEEFDQYIMENIQQRNDGNIINYLSVGKSASMSVPTPDHFYPLLYILGALEESDQVKVYNMDTMLGSLSMTSYLFQ